MQSILTFGEILKTLARLETYVEGLNEYYTIGEPRTPIDDALIDQFLAKASVLTTAAEQLKQVVYTPEP